MQGSSHNRTEKFKTAVAFAIAFFAGAVVVFAAVSAAGTMLGTAQVSRQSRLALAGMSLLALAAVDLLAISKATYCPIGWRRQTPRVLLRHRPVRIVAAIWGFDTGLAVTTFRVAAITWGALLLAGFGLAPAWVGLGYALGFTGPFMVLLWRHRVGRCSRATTPADPGLESLLGKRAVLQKVSSISLAAGGAILIGSVLA